MHSYRVYIKTSKEIFDRVINAETKYEAICLAMSRMDADADLLMAVMKKVK